MYKMMTPGPTMTADSVMQARSRKFGNPDVDSDFCEEYHQVCRSLARLLHTDNEVYILGGEGILALEAACASLTEPGDKVLVIDNGIFGKGFADFVTIYGGCPELYTVDYHKPVEVEGLRRFLENNHDYKYATVVHCDTPSGVLNDVGAICPLLREYGILTVVDSVAAMFGEEVRVDDWCIDIVCGGSQKALSAPPGLAFVTVSEAAMAAMEKRQTPIASFYCNLLTFKNYYRDKWFPYTMPISDIYGLAEAVRLVEEDTGRIERHRKIAAAVRKAVKKAGLSLYLEYGDAATVTVVNVPEGLTDTAIIDTMKNDYGILISGCFDVLAGKVFRLGHMGNNANTGDVADMLSALTKTLNGLGFSCRHDMRQEFLTEIDTAEGIALLSDYLNFTLSRRYDTLFSCCVHRTGKTERKWGSEMEFIEFIKRGFVILDGATGSNLQKAGMKSGECPEQWIVEHPDIFIELQKKYIEAGSDVLYTPTFTCNRIKLEEYGLADRQAELTRKLVDLTKEAIRQSNTDRRIYIAGDISMTGQQLEPVGSLPFETLVDVYKEEVSLLAGEGVDVFAIETMMSLQECRAALLAVKETCDIPAMVTLTYQEDGRTLYGTNPETAVVVLQAMGAAAVGINCSTGPDKMLEAVKRMAEYASVPLIVKPNAGLPSLVDGVTCYDMRPEEFAENMLPLVRAGASVLGGCCGTTPEHIKRLSEAVKQCTVPKREKKNIRVLTTERNIMPFDLDGNFIVIGERINPTGKKALQEELKAGCLDMVLDMAEEQVARGARILDVNMGMNGIDEKEMMKKAVNELTMAVDVPLSIDSSYVEVVESALRIYPGRALINSISLEKEKFEKLLPVAKKYGAMFILLPLSEKGLPKDIEEKKEIIHTILAEAKRLSLSEEDIVVDGLVATIGANKKAALEVLETIRYCKNELNLATVCGLSNISFGLPERVFVNSAFLTLAIGEGLTMAIANPSQTLLTNAALATDLLLNKEEADIRYINGVSEATVTQAQPKQETAEVEGHPLYTAVVKGKSGHIIELVENELAQGAKPAELIDKHMIPAINYVGDLFEKKKYFLPQLIASAETMEKAITRLEPLLETEKNGEKLDTIVMATVKGDIHDIGKNLVVLMLKNYGYDVIDLGKDVEAQEILDTAKRTRAAVIGLSALMTTTMMEMKQVVDMAKEQGVTAKIIIGGAVVTESFAGEIGADGYSGDAGEAVKLVSRLLNK